MIFSVQGLAEVSKLGKSVKRHRVYRCYWCGLNLHWREVITEEVNGKVVCVRCPICERAASELELEAVDIDEYFEEEGVKREEEVLVPPKPSWLYYCYNCGCYVPWNKVTTIIRKGRIFTYRCPSCGEAVSGEKTAATWLDDEELARLTGCDDENNVGRLRSFVFQVEDDPSPECCSWPFVFRAEIGYPLRCACCGATFIDFLCWFCQHGKDISEPDCCSIKHTIGRVTFCSNFKQGRNSSIDAHVR